MSAILKVKDTGGNWIDIPAIIGPTGPQGPAGTSIMNIISENFSFSGALDPTSEITSTFYDSYSSFKDKYKYIDLSNVSGLSNSLTWAKMFSILYVARGYYNETFTCPVYLNYYLDDSSTPDAFFSKYVNSNGNAVPALFITKVKVNGMLGYGCELTLCISG